MMIMMSIGQKTGRGEGFLHHDYDVDGQITVLRFLHDDYDVDWTQANQNHQLAGPLKIFQEIHDLDQKS